VRDFPTGGKKNKIHRLEADDGRRRLKLHQGQEVAEKKKW
jgi:hypothetical protein